MKTDWEITQDRQLRDYTDKGASVFSGKGRKGAQVAGKLLNRYIPNGICLDVGCGILPLPEYMRLAPDVIFVGIDPFETDGRQFRFVKGIAEDMPFEDTMFDSVIFATSLEHMIDPQKAIDETFRVLKKHGLVLIWGTFHKCTDLKYRKWCATKSLAIYNHPWAFTMHSANMLMHRFKSIRNIDITTREKILLYRKN